MGDRTFNNPLCTVMMMDGTEFEVQTLNPDLLRFERTAVKHKWAGPSESPVNWLTFIAWAAATREQLIPKTMTWEVFSEQCAEVRNPRGAVAVDPTDPGVDIDS